MPEVMRENGSKSAGLVEHSNQSVELQFQASVLAKRKVLQFYINAGTTHILELGVTFV